MKTTKHFALVVLLVVGSSAPAMAGGRLYPVGDEPNASGRWRADIPPVGQVIDLTSYIKVSCTGLTPGKTYDVGSWFRFFEYGTWWEAYVIYGSFVADKQGRGGIAAWFGPGWPWGPIEVYRHDGGLVLSSSP